MSLTEQDIIRIAKLARIHMEDPAEIHQELNQIFKMIETLRTVDTTDVTPMSHALDVTLTPRPDVVTEPNLRAQYQAVAPQTEDGLYLVPTVIEQE